jgi:hypothetical protein
MEVLAVFRTITLQPIQKVQQRYFRESKAFLLVGPVCYLLA